MRAVRTIPRRQKLSKQISDRGYSCIGLDNPKFKTNIGGVLRAAYIYDVSLVVVSRAKIKRIATDTPHAYRHIPCLSVDDLHNIIPFDCVPVAIEIKKGAISLHEYKHPQRAFYIFGAESETLGKRILSWCKDVVYIPGKTCMNLAACVNVVLYDRNMKIELKDKP